MASFSSAGYGYTHNSNLSPTFVGGVSDTNRYDFRLGSDSAAKGNGTNLSSLISLCPGITNDILGTVRGLFWDTGAFQSDSNLILWLSFNNWNGTNVVDDSGYGNTAIQFNTNGNWPVIT